MLFMSCVFHAFVSVHCCLVVTCWERADLLALLCDVYLCFVTFPCYVIGQVWYLIVSIPDLCHLSYFISCFCIWPLLYSLFSTLPHSFLVSGNFCCLLKTFANSLDPDQYQQNVRIRIKTV